MLLVVFVLAALTPFWIVYGLIGKLLTTSSSIVSFRGFAITTLCAIAVIAEIAYVEWRHRDSLLHAREAQPTAQIVGTAVVVAIGALLLAQYKFHSFIMFVVDHPSETEGALIRLSSFVVPLCVIFSMWGYVATWKHWELVSGLSLYIFLAVYLAVPVIVALSHARYWVPARYSELERLERELLSRNLTSKFEMLKVAGLGTVHVPCTNPAVKIKKNLVLIHGFAAGNGLWACNLEFLAQYYDVYAVEWVGKGRSDRPDFASYEQETADAVFVGAIEEWRKELKLDTFYLAGHSMGAMFASSYAVRYPAHVEHLILISPAGVGQPPPPKPLSLGIRIFRYLWNLKLTPMSVARYAGPFGPSFIRFIARTRIGVMPETSAMKRSMMPIDLVGDYWYHNWALKASGEVAMHTHLHPGVFAKKPLCEILTPESIKIPITFMYGGGPDWMEPRHGRELAKKFEGHQRVQVLLVPLAGHQVFTDNVDDFNMMLHQAIEGTI